MCIYMCVYIYMCVCVYIHMYICIYVSMHIHTYIHKHTTAIPLEESLTTRLYPSERALHAQPRGLVARPYTTPRLARRRWS